MKRTIGIVFLSLVLGNAIAQTTSGEVRYKVKINSWSHFPEDMDEDKMDAIKEWVPEWMIADKILLFTPEESLFINAPIDDSDEEIDPNTKGGGMRFMMMGGEMPDEQYYTNITEQTKVEQKDLMGKLFLIEDSLTTPEWKLPGETKNVLGYTCMNATTMRDSMEFEVWFTMDIPVSTGPMGAHGLPGLILEGTTDNGNFIVVADSISLREVTENELVKPEKGKKVTQEEYDEIAMEKYKEMEEQRGGGHGKGGMFIMRHEP